jgi:transposase-like protein
MEWAPGVMSSARRSFTNEFKDAAVRRLQLRASLAGVARGWEVNPGDLHCWERDWQTQ